MVPEGDEGVAQGAGLRFKTHCANRNFRATKEVVWPNGNDTVLRIETLRVRIPSLFSFRVVGWERASLWTILPCQSADRVGGRDEGGGPRGGVGGPKRNPV